MVWDSIKFSIHGTIKMMQRDIDIEDVIFVVQNGEVLFEHVKDKPFPSPLVLGWMNKNKYDLPMPLHVVCAQYKSDNSCIVITAYWPDGTKWNTDFKTKK